MGQLNNLYVSKSFQGLLKMTNSATGVTGTLQTVQTGDGTDTPLQISQTEVNISGSLTVNGSPISFTNTGSFATTGSNTFIGNQSITGSVDITGQYLINGVPFSGGSNGTSGTSGSNGSDGSSGTSGSNGSSGTSGTSGSNGSDGSSGTSGSSGNDGLGLPAKNIYVDNTNWTGFVYPTNTSSEKIITFAQPFASSDYSVDFIYRFGTVSGSTGGDESWIDLTVNNTILITNKTASGFTITLSGTQDPIASFTGFTAYATCIATGSSNGSGLDGSSGTSGTSGGSGSSGTNGTSGTSGTSPSTVGFITTGSIATSQAITGSLIISGSQSNTGSLTNVGDVYIFNPAFNNSSLKLNITGSNSISGSNLIFGNTTSATSSTGSIILSGSNNILLTSNRAVGGTTGFRDGYINGNGNIVSTIPTISTSSIAAITTNNNYFAAAAQFDITNGSNNYQFINNYVQATTIFRHKSGSFEARNNNILGNVSSFATSSFIDAGLAYPILYQSNFFQGTTTSLLNVSSSISAQRNIINSNTTIINNQFTNPSNYAVNGSGSLTFTNNIFGGNVHTVLSSGSALIDRNIQNNLVAGYGHVLNQIGSGSVATQLSNTAILGANLIVSGSGGSGTTGGSAFVGRWNATGSLQETTSENIFVVGAGASAAARKNALRIDSSGNSAFTGSVSISGSLTLNGVVVSSDRNGLITTGSAGGTQTITGSLNVTTNINDLKIHTGSANVNSIGIGANTLSSLSGSSLSNVAIGNDALRFNVTGSQIIAIGNGALGNSQDGFNTAIGASALGALVYGSQNTVIGQSGAQALITGSKNLAFGFNTMVNVVSGSNNTAIGTGTLQRNISGSSCVVIGNQAGSWSTSNNEFFIGNDNYFNQDGERSGSMFWGVFNNTTSNQTLQINAATDIRNNLVVSGSLSVDGNLQFNVGDFYSTQIQSGSAGVSGSVTYNNTGTTYGVSLVSSSQLTIANAGVYSITFSAQLRESAGTDTIYMWLKKNGTNVADTATKTVVRNNDENIMTVEYFVEAAANDYYEIVFQNNNGHAQLYYEAASGNIPATPSIITTVKQIR